MCISNNSLAVGWLDPNGEMYECECYDHISYAADLVKQYKYEQIRENYRLLSSDEVLIKNGWVQIGRSGGFLFHTPCWRIGWNPRGHLTPEQKAVLTAYFEGGETIYPFDLERWEEEQ